jgi:8-amino-7-oxononanoate synthase
MVDMDDRRRHLFELADALKTAVGGDDDTSHIRPLIVGDPKQAVALSNQLLEYGYKVLPIRTPTVPPGTDRLRFSLSSDLNIEAIKNLKGIIEKLNR